eukprot:5269387-Pleurochrysis_carterae.AAC.2
MLEMSTTKEGDAVLTRYDFKTADKTLGDGEMPLRKGLLAVLPDLEALQTDFAKLVDNFDAAGPDPLNVVHLAINTPIDGGVEGEENLIATATEMISAQAEALKSKGIRLVSLMVPNPPKWPRIFSFPLKDDYKEAPARRNLYATMYNLLELDRLENWSPERLPAISHNSVVLLGQQGTRPRVQQRLFCRGVTHMEGISDPAAAEAALLKALDELQFAMLDTRVSPTASSHLFLHVLSPIDSTPVEAIEAYKELMSGLISKHATRLLKLSVDEIEVRIHTREEKGGPRQAVRLMASSMSGQWLKLDGFLEYLDPITGTTVSYCSVGEDETCYLEPYPVSTELQTKRAIARRIGTTYAYDFLGLFEKGVVRAWQRAIAAGTADKMPTMLLEADELLLDDDGNVYRGSRVVGTNKVGMLGWHLTLKTPEYPEGRPLVIIANDCTVQSGSFGLLEDNFFDAVSKYARASGLPRLHIASNSGARIGLAEELKPFFKVAWNDPANVGSGFKYLYLSAEDAEKFGEGVFNAEVITEAGEKRFRLDAIVGQQDGIGVENLRGSGMIAGETSAAYDETFTLSYVTGRSVGIGAYVNRLAQRVIQMDNGPIILTGFSALNKLLGREVYNSQDQLGGPQIMLPNGVSHKLAADDQDGVDH